MRGSGRTEGLAVGCRKSVAIPARRRGGSTCHTCPSVANPDDRCRTRAFRNVAKQFGGQDLWRELLAVMKRVADKHGVSMANVALKWVMQQVRAGPAGAYKAE